MLKYLHVYIQKLNGKFSWEYKLEPQLNKVAVKSSSSKYPDMPYLFVLNTLQLHKDWIPFDLL